MRRIWFIVVADMAFVVIFGPMKSGKSLELISRVAPYEFAHDRVLYVQPSANTRDQGVWSRGGLNARALKVNSLNEVSGTFDVIGIDEINMFPADDVHRIADWIAKGKHIYISGLDLDYRAEMPEVCRRILTLKPDEVVFKKAVCDVCRKFDARYTQIIHKGEELLGGISSIAPEDGTYEYQARCRKCFKRAKI
mgnify:CR=1 FL=1